MNQNEVQTEKIKILRKIPSRKAQHLIQKYFFHMPVKSSSDVCKIYMSLIENIDMKKKKSH